MKAPKKNTGILYLLVLLILIFVILYSAIRILELTAHPPTDDAFSGTTKTVVRDGVAYFPRQDINVILVMGIDQEGPAQSSGFYRNRGAADLVMLLIFDEKDESCSILYLNRDTMLEMPVLGVGGKTAGSFYGQLALSHTYGEGLEDSCENTKKAVSDFLNGIHIDYYISMRMDAISVLNDAVGGVTVSVEDDFSQVDPTIGKGQVTLWGEQAINFVRTRKGVGDQLNLSRIHRQEAFIDGFAESFAVAVQSDGNFALRAYEQVDPYLVTDCSVNTISALLSRYEGYEIRQIVTPQGENVLGGEYYEFYADREKLDALILQLFYAPK